MPYLELPDPLDEVLGPQLRQFHSDIEIEAVAGGHVGPAVDILVGNVVVATEVQPKHREAVEAAIRSTVERMLELGLPKSCGML